MANPYAQVALTYLRRPVATWPGRLVCLLVLLMFLPMSMFARRGCYGTNISWHSIFMPFVCLFAFYAIHVKDQFADARAYLTPGFRRIHGAVAAAAALLLAVFLPAMITWFADMRSVGLTAVVMLLFGGILWLVLTQSTCVCLLLVVGWFALMSQSGQICLIHLTYGASEPQAVGLLLLGLLVALLGWLRLVRLNEDMPEYHLRMGNLASRSQMSRQTQARAGEGMLLTRLRDWVTERQMARLTSHARRATDSYLSRAYRWQVGMVGGWSLWFWIIGTFLYLQVMSIGMPSNSVELHTMAMMSFISSIIPAISVMGAIHWRATRMGFEAALPVERKSYIRQLGAAMLLSHVSLWLGVVAALIIWLWFCAPQPPPVAKIGGLLVFSSAFQIAVFGLAAWIGRFRSQVPAVIVLAVLFPAHQLLQMRWSRLPSAFPNELFWIAGVLALLGLLITFDAYRRWLWMDFD